MHVDAFVVVLYACNVSGWTRVGSEYSPLECGSVQFEHEVRRECARDVQLEHI